MRQETTPDFLPIQIGLKEVLSRMRSQWSSTGVRCMCQHRATASAAVVMAEDRRQAEEERIAEDCQEEHTGNRCSSWVGSSSAADILCTLI